jgi:transposase-like protein
MTFLLILQILALGCFILVIAVVINFFGRKNTSSKAHLKKDEVLKVSVKDGRWKCPSCNDTNLEIKIDCGSCGQKVTKQ